MKNKILTISIIFILISFLFINNSVFAMEAEDTYTFPTDLVGEHCYFIYYHKGYKCFYGQVFRNVDVSSGSYFKVDSNGYTHLYDSENKELNSTAITVIWTADGENWAHQVYNQYITFDFTNNDMVETSHDILKSDGTLFFQKPQKMTLGGIMKTAGEQATAEMGQIILIVIVITAGLIVLLIGLKKGLKVLMNGFRH